MQRVGDGEIVSGRDNWVNRKAWRDSASMMQKEARWGSSKCVRIMKLNSFAILVIHANWSVAARRLRMSNPPLLHASDNSNEIRFFSPFLIFTFSICNFLSIKGVTTSLSKI